MALRSGPCVFTNLSVCSPVCLPQCGLSGLHVCLCLPVCVAHVCWYVVSTCRSFLLSGLCGGPLFGVIKVLLGFPVVRISCDPAPCPAEVNVRFLLHPLLNLSLLGDQTGWLGRSLSLLSLPLRDAVTGAGFSVGGKDLHSGSHNYKASTALAEPSPQPLVSIFFNKLCSIGFKEAERTCNISKRLQRI